MAMFETKKAEEAEGFWERAAARLVVEKQQLKDEVIKLKKENGELQDKITDLEGLPLHS